MSSPLDVEENRQDCGTTINEQPKNSVALLRFPAKIYDTIVHSSEHNSEIAQWDENGTSFTIKDRSAFEKTYLVESYWGSQNGDILFESFQRQLNSYGFKKVNSRRGGRKQAAGKHLALVYHHDNFRKGHIELLEKIETADVGLSSKKARSQSKKSATMEIDLNRIEAKVDQLNDKFTTLLSFMERQTYHQIQSDGTRFRRDKSGRAVSPPTDEMEAPRPSIVRSLLGTLGIGHPLNEVQEERPELVNASVASSSQTATTGQSSNKNEIIDRGASRNTSNYMDNNQKVYFEDGCFDPLPYNEKGNMPDNMVPPAITSSHQLRYPEQQGKLNYQTKNQCFDVDNEEDCDLFPIGEYPEYEQKMENEGGRGCKRMRRSTLTSAMVFSLAIMICAISISMSNGSKKNNESIPDRPPSEVPPSVPTIAGRKPSADIPESEGHPSTFQTHGGIPTTKGPSISPSVNTVTGNEKRLRRVN